MPEVAPEGSIIITPKEFYDGVKQDVSDIKSSQAEIKAAVAPLPERVTRLEAELTELRDRQDSIDRKIAWFTGAAAAVGSVAGTVLPRLF